MESARDHLDQAELCLDMARHMSDRHAAELLRATAARHFTQAAELDKTDVDGSKVMKEPPEDFRNSFYYRAIRTGIGAALRTSVDAPVPDRISELLRAFDEARRR
jgi:hypothetical protein